MASLRRLSLITLGFTLLVILWGGWVRVSFSGAGCGEHWPLCNGEIIPRSPSTKTLVEFFHRLTSGLNLLLVLFLGWRVFKRTPQKSTVRKAALYAVIFILLEALIGAGLVLFSLVAENKSLIRGFSLSIHLVNTFFLLGALTATTFYSTRFNAKPKRPPNSTLLPALILLALLILTGMSGAIAALGDTLFSAPESWREALNQDFSSLSHWFIRLRVLHPVFAVTTAFSVLLSGRNELAHVPQKKLRFKAALLLNVASLIQLGIGVLNLWLRAPNYLQLVHLIMADTVWILFCVWFLTLFHEEKS